MAAMTLTRFLVLTALAGSFAVGCRPPDFDEDGYNEELDCDDEDADIYPGADEYCDGVDNNCDGQIDEAGAVNETVWYGDGDGDGYGLDSSLAYACNQPAEHVGEGGDCDDENPALNPETWWYADADLDGYGDPEAGTQVCDQPSGYVADNTDCDDTAADVNPGQDEICDEIDHDCDDDNGLYDTDGDGYAICEDDCDDDDPEQYPGADEYCNGEDDDCDGTVDENEAVDAPTWYLDVDEDGYGGPYGTQVDCEQPKSKQGQWVDNIDDCDDTKAEVYPGAPEYCDGLDNDCDKDGAIDESPAVDAPTYYYDADGDGYGVDTTTTTDECEPLSGYAEEAGDCDDADINTYPDAPEYCDGHDDNCDGTVDEDSAVDAAPWYEDLDGDDFGNAAVVDFACDQPSGYAAVSGDCDETDSTINPDADEYCDGADNDCDGVTDEGDALDADTWYADTDGDEYGDAGSSQTACSEPTGYVSDSSDCDDSDASINPGVDELCNDGIDNDCDASSSICTMDVADSDAVFLGENAGDDLGRFITTIGDVNADGIDDLMTSSRLSESGAGATFVYHGSASLQTLGQVVVNDGTEAGKIIGSDTSYKTGFTGSGGGDLDGDGVDDFGIGSPNPESSRGEVWLYFDDPSGDAYTDEADVIISGDSTFDYLAAAGGLDFADDLDDDGYDDLLIAAFSDDTGTSNSGTVYVGYGPMTSGTDMTAGSIDDLVYGTTASDAFGRVVRDLGDLDGDGLGSFASATYLNNGNTGIAFIYHTTVSGSIADTDADVIITGEDASDYFGTAVAPLGGDLNGDGYDDFLVTATHDDLGGTDTGAVYVIPGDATSDVVDMLYIAKIYGDVASGKFGSAVDGTGDYYGDHSYTQGILVGANNQGTSTEGAVYLFLGPTTGTIASSNAVAVLEGTDPSDSMGSWVEFSGDLDGTGAPAVLTCSNGADLNGAGAGAGYVLFGVGE